MRAIFFTNLLIAILTWAGCPAKAQVSNVALQATLSGVLGIQGVGQGSQPVVEQAGFQNDSFQSIVGISPQTDRVIALNFEFLSTGTNMFLTVFDRADRQPTDRITAAESTIFISDGEAFTFRVSAQVPTRFPAFAGGLLEIAGHGRIQGGVPSGVSASVRGYLIDARPFDSGGTTGIIIRASLKTGVALRVQPPVAQ